MATYRPYGNNFQFLTTTVATFIGNNFLVVNFLGGSFQGGNFQRGEISEGGTFIGGYFHRGQFSYETIFQGAIFTEPFILDQLLYINDLSDNLQCNPKLFADDTPLFSTAKMQEKTANNLIKDLKAIN